MQISAALQTYFDKHQSISNFSQKHKVRNMLDTCYIGSFSHTI